MSFFLAAGACMAGRRFAITQLLKPVLTRQHIWTIDSDIMAVLIGWRITDPSIRSNT